MSLPGVFPIYPDNLLTGPYHVSLSLPGKQSEISKSIGITNSTSFLIPNTDFLDRFVKGDIGIGDSILKNLMMSNFNSPEASKDESVFRMFAKLNKIEIDDISKYKKGNRFVMPEESIKIDPSLNNLGVKSIEKTILTSMFETQKPYMDIAKLFIENLSNIEDIIARVMPLASISPLTSKSEKPKTNSGDSTKPKALGYKNGEELKSSISKINSLANGKEVQGKKSTKYDIISEIYSTGKFDPYTNYKYTYIDLPPDNEIVDLKLNNDEKKDPYQKYRPEKIILGIFNSNGQPLNPKEKLKTVGILNNTILPTPTPFDRASWILKSPKWVLPDGVYQWPSYGDPTYIWERGLSTTESKSNPNPDATPSWSIKKYKEDDINRISGATAIPGNPIITKFDTPDITEYQDMLNDYMRIRFLKSELSVSDKIKYMNEISSNLDVKSHIQNIFLYSQTKSNYTGDVPFLLRRSFKPIKIFSSQALVDPDIIKASNQFGFEPGFIWIDPESDYDMKIIRVDPTTKIKYKEPISESSVSGEIDFFIKNRSIFKMFDGSTFSVSSLKNGFPFVDILNVTEYSIDNWNYENLSVVDNTYNLTIWSETPPTDTSEIIDSSNKSELSMVDGVWVYRKYSIINLEKVYSYFEMGDIVLPSKRRVEIDEVGRVKKWYHLYKRNLIDDISLPPFSIIRNFTIDVSNVDDLGDGNITFVDEETTLYNIRVNSDDRYGSLIDPSKVTNDQLSSNDLFVDIYGKSEGIDRRYGHGSPDHPQSVKVIDRYKLTDLDTESYFIIEGVLRDSGTTENKTTILEQNQNNTSNKEWYTIGDSMGVFKVFVNMLVDVFSKLIPNIQKLIDLLRNPTSFISSIIGDKLQNNVLFLSKETLQTFKEGKSIDTNNKVGIKELKDHFKNSNLSNYVFVNDFGNPISLLDGFGTIPLSIFDRSINFGIKMEMGSDIPLSLISNPTLSNIKNLQKELNSSSNIMDKKPNIKSFQNISDDGEYTQIRFKDGSSRMIESSSLDQFIIDNKTKYNFIYLNESIDLKISEADKLIEVGDVESLSKAKMKLDDVLKSRPNDLETINKIKDIDKNLGLLKNGQQPMVKMILGIVSAPLKIVAGIIEYLMSFFKGLSNPLSLPSKISELLSFEWIFKWFEPSTLLEIIGIKFNIKKESEWKSKSNTKSSMKDKLPKSLKLPPDIKIKGFNFGKIKSGNYNLDDEQLVDLSESLSLTFGVKTPKLSALQFRQSSGVASNLLKGFLFFIEKVINGIIDFFWSLLGLEALKDAPHIKLCNSVKGSNESKVLNNEPGADLEQFIYEVQLPNGEVKQLMNEDELNKFIEDNKDLLYDFNF